MTILQAALGWVEAVVAFDTRRCEQGNSYETGLNINTTVVVRAWFPERAPSLSLGCKEFFGIVCVQRYMLLADSRLCFRRRKVHLGLPHCGSASK
ncbi:hypothetical protein F5141DRAFT_444063 [Pisolithus sp. B1]|nr:hypothetical protein F5141DRAFT_444063 [Pisolithus sp. B1]